MSKEENGNCFVCNKHNGQVYVPGGAIYQDDSFFISHATLFGEEKEHYLGHVFIETKRHIAQISEMNTQEAKMFGVHSQRVAQALLATLPMEHIYSYIIGDGVPHLHVHIIGRYQNAPKPYWGPRVDDWPDAPKGDNKKIEELSRQLKNYFIENQWQIL